MSSLNTTYLGLELVNPIIVASSGLTNRVEKVIQCEKAGAGAVVLKSLFEEVLAKENWGLDGSTKFHTEAYDYLQAELEIQYGTKDYTELITRAKESVNIPVIASINCVSSKWWTGFAKQVESAGADAIELNVFTTANNTVTTGAEIENLHYEIVENIKANTTIPVALKISSYFSSIPNLAVQLDKRKLDGLVLFNKFVEPDMNIDELELKTTFKFSTSNDIYKTLRWIALLSDKVNYALCATTGIHTSEEVVKMLLAGASSVQIASELYTSGLTKIKEICDGIKSWMLKHNFNSIDDFKGKLSFANTKKRSHYLRAQFMKKIKDFE